MYVVYSKLIDEHKLVTDNEKKKKKTKSTRLRVTPFCQLKVKTHLGTNKLLINRRNKE